jgi:hypothetical protein
VQNAGAGSDVPSRLIVEQQAPRRRTVGSSPASAAIRPRAS